MFDLSRFLEGDKKSSFREQTMDQTYCRKKKSVKMLDKRLYLTFCKVVHLFAVLLHTPVQKVAPVHRRVKKQEIKKTRHRSACMLCLSCLSLYILYSIEDKRSLKPDYFTVDFYKT